MLTSQKPKLIFRIFFDNPTGEAFMYIMWKHQRCIFILSRLFWQRNRNALYFVRVLYFVRWWPSLGVKFGIPDEFPPNCFPITPPRNGNIGNGYRVLLESGFKVGKNSPMPKKIAPSKFLQKKTTTFLEHDHFPLLKLKMWFFVQECAAELPFLTPVKIIFQNLVFFYRYCCRYGCALYFVRTLYFVRPL